MIKIKISDLIIDSKRWGKITLSKVPYHTVGWVVKWQGKEYGDFVTITDQLTDETLRECASIFTEQANDTMIQVIGDQYTSETGLDWKGFAMNEMKLKDDCGVKIQTKEEVEASLEKYKAQKNKKKE